MDGGYCDTCGPAVRSQVIVDLHNGTLEYCLHHANKYRQRLLEAGAHLQLIERD